MLQSGFDYHTAQSLCRTHCLAANKKPSLQQILVTGTEYLRGSTLLGRKFCDPPQWLFIFAQSCLLPPVAGLHLPGSLLWQNTRSCHRYALLYEVRTALSNVLLISCGKQSFSYVVQNPTTEKNTQKHSRLLFYGLIRLRLRNSGLYPSDSLAAAADFVS